VTVGPVVIETRRLVLRELVEDDLDFVAGMLGNTEVSRYYAPVHARGCGSG
jgi:hypothetical protein